MRSNPRGLDARPRSSSGVVFPALVLGFFVAQFLCCPVHTPTAAAEKQQAACQLCAAGQCPDAVGHDD